MKKLKVYDVKVDDEAREELIDTKEEVKMSRKQERIMDIAGKALEQVLTQAGFSDDGSFEKVSMQAAYDNLDIEHESKMSDEELFDTYYGWFKDALENNEKYYVWTTSDDNDYFEGSYEDYDEAVKVAKSNNGVVRHSFTTTGYEEES
ncbi:hypothetical protein E4P35_14430 [Thiopseudomonas sp. 4R-3cl]|nr:hypothetical protein E4P35_14430 [Thiopseudomonas sp. 4R-3cl]